MEGNPNEHIGGAELAKLLEESRQRAGSVRDAADTHPHLAACSACREQFEKLALAGRQLTGMRPAESAQRQGDCPDRDMWREIAGGLIPPDETFTHVEHASRCDYCGPLLREAIAELAELNGEMTEAEREHIASLESGNAEWQQRLARRITGTPQPGTDRRPAAWWQWLSGPRLAMAGVSLLAVIGVGSWVVVHRYQVYRNQPAAAERLLARAYSQQRTLELRIAGADFAPMRVSRGPLTSFTDSPAPLSKAKALIASQLKSHPSDPSWLQAKAQADLLDGKYDAAVEALRRALELEPNSPALLIDLATAYFQRAQAEDKKDDLGAAYEYLSQALKLRPDDPVALFNRAIVAEHQSLYHQALDDWNRYLQVDPRSDWAGEAREAGERVRTKLNAHDASQAAPLLSPTQIASSADDPNLRSALDARIEEYLHEAVRSWLPQAYPEKGAADAAAQRALFFLADLTTRQHSDRWLADLLSGSSAPHFPQAAAALARAVKANDIGDYDVSGQQADLAEQLFRASGNTAGVLRTEFEQSFAAQMTRSSEDCRRRSIAAGAESKRYAYTWVRIQLELEASVCSLLMGDIGANDNAARHALDRAQQAGYGALYLRALGFIAENRFVTGDRAGGWQLVCAGLKRYWSGQFPALRGYNLYSDLARAADDAGQSTLQVAIWREALTMIDADENLPWRAWAHSTMAKAAVATQQPEIAEHQYAEAARLYALVPQTAAIRADRIETEIRTAQFEARQSAFDTALARLTRVQGEVRQLSNNYLAQIFYSTLGEVQLRSHHEAAAEQAFRPALRLAEKNLASLTSEASRIRWSKDAAPVYLGLAEAVLLQGRVQDSLDAFEWYLGAPQRAGMREPATPQSLPDPSLLSARLPFLSHQTVLAYGLLPDGLAIWVYDNRGVSAKWIPQLSQELQDLAAGFYAQCSDPSSQRSALRRNGQALYSLLIAPVEQMSQQSLDPKRTLVIEAEGFLARLPFEALVDANGHYLIERGPIVHSPGPFAEARMHPDTAISSHSPALIVGSAASWPDAGLFPDPSVPTGADAVASSFVYPVVLKGTEATLGAVRSALPAAAVFHFTGHAITTFGHAGLMLEGRDARTGAPVLLDATVLRHLNLPNTQLAVLAACSTDSGEGTSRGFDSVAEALQTSGVPHVVASRWAVDSVEANAYVNYFYGFLLSGQTAADAARLTTLKMLSTPGTPHPYYWAAFAAYGRP
ncbi:MAG TPA: CHAT domain-containing protein [Terriglobales bacterium]|nr:CHAT domain-containing protein [Terriglobales bacterium]